MKSLIFLASCLALGAAQQSKATPSEVLYETNKTFKLDCVIDSELGNNVKYEWQKDGKVLSSDSKASTNRDGSLQVQNPDTNTEGVYRCLATSDFGVASSAPISVKRMYINVPKVELKKHSPVKGDPFELDCPQVEAYPKPTIAWLKQTSEPSSTKNVLTFRTTIGPDGFLYFANVTEEDAGSNLKYICSASHPAEKEPVTLAEHVIHDLRDRTETGLRKAAPQYLSDKVVAKEGDETFLYCIYGGAIAPPDYFFKGNNVNGDEEPEKERVTRHNRSKGRRLLIKETRLTDQGHYSCKISEADGATTTHLMGLTVVSAPTYIQKPEKKITAKTGEHITLPCHVKGVPKPKITWTYNAKTLLASERLTFSTLEQSDELIIESVGKWDSGYYGCKAVNDIGEVYTETFLSVA